MADPSINVGTHTVFKGVTDSGRVLLNESLEANITEWMKWCLLGIGDFFNVTIPTSGTYGGNWHRLSPAKDQNYTDGQVWQSARQEWVWESGVQYGTQPIAISGIFVNNVFRPNGSGYYIDYPRGRVVFDTPIATTGNVVSCEYSFRHWQVSTASVPWWREIQTRSMRVDDFQFVEFGSGAWDVLADYRIQLPHVVVQSPVARQVFGLNVGGGHMVRQEIICHIITEEPTDLSSMADILTYQTTKTIQLFDKNKISDSGVFPLDYRGAIASGARCYPDLVTTNPNGYYLQKAQIINTRADDFTVKAPPYYAQVKLQLELDQPW